MKPILKKRKKEKGRTKNNVKQVLFYNENQFFVFKKQMPAGYKLVSLSDLILKSEPLKLNNDTNYFIDISSLVAFIKNNDTQTLSFEQLLNGLSDNVAFVCDKKYEQDIRYLLRFVFDKFENMDVEAEQPSFVQEEPDSSETRKIKKITDLTDAELNAFFEKFDSRLYGHGKFKEEFKELVTSFRVFNKLGEHKVLSLFLMGDSGVGKTEVARSIHKALGSQAKLAKVNFGNYSSHDALNSLIGSPLGYIGSDGGELVKRLSESDIGLILIDEFEKADNAVFNYFLDVLENGRIVNSQAEEYDVDGYIMVFTSNISKDDFKKKLSPELRSRFDYIGMFNLLTTEDKRKYVHYRINQIVAKYREKVSIDLPEEIHSKVFAAVDVNQYKNMRDLNKKIKDVFVETISQLN